MIRNFHMKTITASLFAACVFALLPASLARAATPDTNPPPRLTVELRDGSRVVGTSVEKSLKFRSALLGDVKLKVNDIRSIASVSTNLAKLTTVNGDSLTVSFMDAAFAVKTSFGKVDLRVDLVRNFSVTAGGMAGAYPPGLVALWSGEGNGDDSVGGNNATLKDITFADGQVGQAFSLNGSSSVITMPASPSLNVGAGDGLTVMAWIKPSDVQGIHPILEWNTDGKLGAHLMIGGQPGVQGVLAGAIIDINGQLHKVTSRQGTVLGGGFQHVSMTYDKVRGEGILYLNGTVVGRSQWGNIVPLTVGDVWVGHRNPSGDYRGSWTYDRFFAGLLDEVAIYNRALSTSEIQAICREQNHGEPLPPPPSAPTFNGRFRQGGFGGAGD